MIIGDVFGVETIPPTRREAMSIPAVVRARNIVCLLGRQPLHTYRDADQVKDPAWLYRTSTFVPPQMRMIATLDDLFFYGWSLWAVERGAAGQIVDAMHVHADRWDFDEFGRVRVGEQLADPEQVILFQGPNEGILLAGARTIRGITKLEEAWISRTAVPIPVMMVEQDDDVELEADEIDELLQGYADARRSANGSVVFVPHGLKLSALGDAGLDLLIAGRNAAVLDIARLTGLPATILDASQVSASLTYSNTQYARSDLQDLSLALWQTAIEARLSQDDVTPMGTRIAFDRINLVTVPDTGVSPATED
ncbi:phage portal family protein [Luteimicrobium xylanilyticum]|uniref:phage portal protein n=1 Tax=Luteimicrobium xylanilyticum TaxID=1133546 RepID=UPI00055E5ACC|nr:phage portal protein [Luteimicrobium xylanilyticum]